MIIFADFETQGLHLAGKPSDDPGHPGAVSLSAILDDEEGKTRRVMSKIICNLRPYKDTGAEKIHGITPAIAKKYGVPCQDVMEEFFEMMRLADTFCAFNAFYDVKCVKIECAHIIGGEDFRKEFEKKTSLCVMEAAAAHLKGPTIKRISLKDAHTAYFGKPHTGAHGSLPDAYAARRIYYELLARGQIPNGKPLTRREYDTPPPGKGAAVAKATEVDF